jgi:hypothetical protein
MALIRRDREGLVRFPDRAFAQNYPVYQTNPHRGGELRVALGTAAKVDLEI